MRIRSRRARIMDLEQRELAHLPLRENATIDVLVRARSTNGAAVTSLRKRSG